MLYLIIGVFAFAAVMGLIIATAIINKRPSTPKPVVYTHGAFAATGLILLIVFMVNNKDHYPQASLILFVVAALGGFILFANDMKGKPGPIGLVVIHALVALTAFVLLLVFTLL